MVLFNHRQTQILYNAPLRGTTADIYSAIGCRHTCLSIVVSLV